MPDCKINKAFSEFQFRQNVLYFFSLVGKLKTDFYLIPQQWADPPVLFRV
jgi:hypothetical protein